MTKETARDVVQYVANTTATNGGVHFFGAEPLLSWNLLKSLTAAMTSIRPDLKMSLTTNGTLLSIQKCTWLESYGFGVLLSNDGTSLANHNRVTVHGESAHRQIQEGLECLLNTKISTSVAATVTPANLSHIVASADYLIGKLTGRPNSFVHFNFDTTRSTWNHLELYKHYLALGNWYYDEGRKKGVIKNWHDVERAYRRSRRKSVSRVTCGAGHGSVGIDWDGRILPCHRDNLGELGSVDEGAIPLDRLQQFTEYPYNECHSCPAYPCSTCASNFKQATGDRKKINREWCKVQLVKWQVNEILYKRGDFNDKI